MPTLKRQWTFADLEDLPDDDGNRYEIIDGELFVTPVIADEGRSMPDGATAPLVIDVAAYFAGVFDD